MAEFADTRLAFRFDCKVAPPSVPFSVLYNFSLGAGVASYVHYPACFSISREETNGTDEVQKCNCWCHGFGIDSCLGIRKQCAGTNARAVTRNANASPGAVATEGGR